MSCHSKDFQPAPLTVTVPCVSVCVCLYVCPCAFNSLSRQPDGFLCLWASVVGPLSLSCDAIILSGAAVFSWGKEVISFPAFVWAWMRAALFQQYSLISTPFSIRTKIYHPCLGPITPLGQKKATSHCFNFPHQILDGRSTGLSGSLSWFSIRHTGPCQWNNSEREREREEREREREREREGGGGGGEEREMREEGGRGRSRARGEEREDLDSL